MSLKIIFIFAAILAVACASPRYIADTQEDIVYRLRRSPHNYHLPDYERNLKHYPTGGPTARPDGPMGQDRPLNFPKDNPIFTSKTGIENDRAGNHAFTGVQVPLYESGRHSLNAYANVDQGLGGGARGWDRDVNGGANYKYNFG